MSIPDNILRDGTSQKTRYVSELNTNNVQVDGRDMEYFLRYVAKIASKLQYYHSSNMPLGFWDMFFPKDDDITKFIQDLPSRNDLAPQVALLLAFIRLMGILKGDINQLSKEHLQFYFEEVLRFERLKAIPEKANVVFEPANNIADAVILAAGNELLAGKTESGFPIILTTDKELTVSKVEISRLSAVLVDQLNESRIYAAPKADSLDGVSVALPKDEPYWNPFGESQVGKSPAERTMIEAKAGFAIASSILLLKEGERNITVTVNCQAYRLIEAQFQAMLAAGVLPAVIEQMQSIKNVLYHSKEEMEAALIAAIGAANFAANQALIFDQLNNPFKLIKEIDLQKAFVLEASGEKGWFPVSNVIVSKLSDSQVRFDIKLTPVDPAVVDLSPIIHQQPIDNTLPIIQFNLNHQNTIYLYDQLRGIKISGLTIAVDVIGVRNIVMQGDAGLLNPAQPFLPFGPIPAAGSSLNFGSREIFSKKLSKLELELAWANLPKTDLPANDQGFSSYYAEYPFVPNNNSFTAKFSVLDKKKWVSVAPNVLLFKTATIGVPPGTHPLFRDVFTINLPLPPYDPVNLPEVKTFDLSITQGFGQLVLNDPDFQHGVFARAYAEKAILKATTTPGQALPNPPYTPKISHFALNYSASVSFAPSEVATAAGDRVFHVEPFGLTPMNDENAGDLLPQFAWGTFFIGLSNLHPPQNVSILFQMVDGSANPDIDVTRHDVKWSYFDRTKWKAFSDVSIQIDTTFGLQTSGITEFPMPNDMDDDGAFWINGLYWLRAEFSKDPSGASKVASVLPNAMVATLRKDQAIAGVLKEPLQPEAITALLKVAQGIKSVKQPFSSFGGKSIEPEIDFDRRVSERLRHKKRGVNIWDYEHLVLEAFPSIYKVKCLPHTGRSIEAEPGAVTLLVIPDLRKRNKINPFQPKVSPVIRGQIAEYITDLRSGFSSVYVDNPKYEQVLVEMSVGLMPGYDGNFYGRLLNEELKRFLSPWAFEEGRDIVFGGKIFKSSILSFVEQREYVDYVTNFKLYHVDRGLGVGDMRIRDNLFETNQDFIVRPDTIGEEVASEIVASSPRSILVTASDHNITILNPGEFFCPEGGAATGIGAMIIEVDFFVY